MPYYTVYSFPTYNLQHGESILISFLGEKIETDSFGGCKWGASKTLASLEHFVVVVVVVSWLKKRYMHLLWENLHVYSLRTSFHYFAKVPLEIMTNNDLASFFVFFH